MEPRSTFLHVGLNTLPFFEASGMSDPHGKGFHMGLCQLSGGLCFKLGTVVCFNTRRAASLLCLGLSVSQEKLSQ